MQIRRFCLSCVSSTFIIVRPVGLVLFSYSLSSKIPLRLSFSFSLTCSIVDNGVGVAHSSIEDNGSCWKNIDIISITPFFPSRSNLMEQSLYEPQLMEQTKFLTSYLGLQMAKKV